MTTADGCHHAYSRSNRKQRAPYALRGDYPALLALFTDFRGADECWPFTGYVQPTGYGQLGRNMGAHRVAWEVANGRPVPEGLVVDHTCHNEDPACDGSAPCPHRRCVNPAHLEAVPPGVNVLRGKGSSATCAARAACSRGHEYTEGNTYFSKRGKRVCRQCHAVYERERRARLREASVA